MLHCDEVAISQKNRISEKEVRICSQEKLIQIFKEFEIFLWKKDAFDYAEIRAQVFRLPVDCSNY